MKVNNSSIVMMSKHKFYKKHTKKESMKVWVKKEPLQTSKPTASQNQLQSSNADTVKISDQAHKQLAPKDNFSVQGEEEIKFEMSDEDKHKVMLLEKFLEKLLGRDVELKIPEKIEIRGNKIIISLGGEGNQKKAEAGPNWAVEYKYEETYLEKEKMLFKAKGQVITNKGEKIKFSLQLKLKRRFFKQEKVLLQAGNKKLIDPLTINLTNKPPELTNEKFNFDLDGDHQEEQISVLKPGSAFLAVDKNKDGKINDGTELFGPTSGDGFAELAHYDNNNDGWIDEQDPIFTELKLWTKDKTGHDQLYLLARHNIGASYLEKVNSLFSLKTKTNQLNGQIKDTGLYIKDKQ